MAEPTDPVEPMPRRPSEPGENERRLHRRALIWRNVCLTLLVVLVGGMLFVITYTSLTIRGAQVTSIRARNSSDRTLATIEDCTSVRGKCYQRGQKQTAKAVGDINRVVILAAACSVGLDPRLPVAERQTEIQSCVIDRLSRQH